MSTGRSQVKCPVVASDSVMGLMRRMLCWAPSSRCSARDAMYDDVFVRSAHSQMDAELDEALAGMSRDGLAALVRHAARTGKQITQSSIRIAAAMAPRQKGREDAASPGSEPTPRAVPGALLDGGGLDGGGVLRASGSQESVHDDCGVVPSTTATAKMCAGNCGQVECKKNQNVGAVVICVECHELGSRCRSCGCETVGCLGARLRHHDGRWCGKCSSKVGVSGPGYANAYGKHTYGKYWDLTLRLTARLGFLLDRMLTMDVVAVERFCHDARNETNAARHAQII